MLFSPATVCELEARHPNRETENLNESIYGWVGLVFFFFFLALRSMNRGKFDIGLNDGKSSRASYPHSLGETLDTPVSATERNTGS